MGQTIQQRIADIRRGNIPAGYQKTKLGIIPADWSTPELNSVLTENKERNRSGRFGKEDVLSVSGEFGVTNQIELLGRSFAGASVKDYHVVEAGNIVYTKSPLKDNPYGIIKLNKGNAGIVSTLYAVYNCTTPSTGLYLDYYFSLDQNVNNYLRPLVRKGTKNDMKINNEDVLKGCVILPPESETAKIVEILVCCDRVIALKKELIAEKKKQKKALMQKLLNPDSGFRLPGFSGKWKTVKLKEVCDINTSSLSENTNPDKYFYYLDLATVDKGKIVNEPAFVTFGNAPCRARRLFKKGDILFSTVRPYLCGFLFADFVADDYVASTGFAILTPQIGNIIGRLLYHHLFSDNIILQTQNLLSGTNYPALNSYDVENLYIDIPKDIKEQQAITDILSTADKEIDLLEQELAQQEQKKKSLMQLLLTGIVRV